MGVEGEVHRAACRCVVGPKRPTAARRARRKFSNSFPPTVSGTGAAQLSHEANMRDSAITHNTFQTHALHRRGAFSRAGWCGVRRGEGASAEQRAIRTHIVIVVALDVLSHVCTSVDTTTLATGKAGKSG